MAQIRGGAGGGVAVGVGVGILLDNERAAGIVN